MTHHPHVHMIVPGGGLSPDGTRWIAARPGFLLPVRVLGQLFRRLFLGGLAALHAAGTPVFFGTLAPLSEPRAFARALAPVRRKRWLGYAKPPFAGPKAVLAYLARYTHRVAISSRRILAFDGARVSFRIKDYRRDEAGRPGIMTLSAEEFIRRFLLHVLPCGFHRIRHYGLLTGSNRTAGLAHFRAILGVSVPPRPTADAPDPQDSPGKARSPCPCCGGRMTIVGSFSGWHQPRGPPFRPASNRAWTP